MIKIQKTEEHYSINMKKNGDDWEPLDFVKSGEVPDHFKMTFYVDRWRSKKESIKLLEQMIAIINDNF